MRDATSGEGLHAVSFHGRRWKGKRVQEQARNQTHSLGSFINGIDPSRKKEVSQPNHFSKLPLLTWLHQGTSFQYLLLGDTFKLQHFSMYTTQ